MKKLIPLMVFAVVSIGGSHASAQCWRPSGDGGLGNPNNVLVFTTTSFGGFVYAGTYNDVDGCQVLRTAATGNPPYTWQQVNTDGFGDPANTTAIPTVFGGHLYAAVANEASGGRVWRTSAVGPPPFTWVPVSTPGLGNSDNEDIHLGVFGSWLYAGTDNGVSGGQVWRTQGLAVPHVWTKVAPDGLGNVQNIDVWPSVEFDNHLMLEVANDVTGCEVWRTDGLGSWEQVGSQGFGDLENELVTLQVFAGLLYAGTGYNSSGTQVWRTDGAGAPPFSWVRANLDGFGKPSNEHIPILAVSGSHLYAGTENTTAGGEVWRTTGSGSPPALDWESAAAPGFGNPNNRSAYPIVTFANQLFAGTENSVSGGEMWTLGDCLTYCTAKTNSQGCLPQIDSGGWPSASAGSGFVVTATQVIPKASGLFFYSKTGAASVPFQGGYLCIASPVRRTPGQKATGSAPCTGTLSIDFNGWIASGKDAGLVSGATVYGQFWSRDPAASFGTNLTDAITFLIAP